jgi:hypothetical protein
MDADDAAFPAWLDRCLTLLDSRVGLGLVGTGVVDVGRDGVPGAVHVHDAGRAAMRWRAMFSAPVFHDTVVLKRHALEENGLRYDTTYSESEDFDLWARLLEHVDGDAVEDPLVLHRLHLQQASRRRGELQRSLAEEISLRQIAALAPDIHEREARLARSVWLGDEIAPEDLTDAASSFVDLERRFRVEQPYDERELRVVRESAARSLARLAAGGEPSVVKEMARLDPLFPVHAAARLARRRSLTKEAGRAAGDLLRALEAAPNEPPLRVVAVFPEPTPYRAPLLDRVSFVGGRNSDAVSVKEASGNISQASDILPDQERPHASKVRVFTLSRPQWPALRNS